MDDKHQELQEKLVTLKEAAKARPDDITIQISIQIVEYLLAQRTALQKRSEHERDRRQFLQEKLSIEKAQETTIQQRITELSEEMRQAAIEKQRILAERDKLRGELQSIDTLLRETVKSVRATTSLPKKFTILWDFLTVVFFDEEKMLNYQSEK